MSPNGPAVEFGPVSALVADCVSKPARRCGRFNARPNDPHGKHALVCLGVVVNDVSTADCADQPDY